LPGVVVPKSQDAIAFVLQEPASLGVPDGSRDLVLEKSILLEAGFDELNGVDWQKGCYIGQS
jgi:folate-binding protein YgfZ